MGFEGNISGNNDFKLDFICTTKVFVQITPQFLKYIKFKLSFKQRLQKLGSEKVLMALSVYWDAIYDIFLFVSTYLMI